MAVAHGAYCPVIPPFRLFVIVQFLLATVLLYATEATHFVGEVRVILKTLEQFAANAYGAYRNHVACVPACGPTDTCNLVHYLEGTLHELVDREVKRLLLLILLLHEGITEGFLKSLIVPFIQLDGIVESQFVLEVLLHVFPSDGLALLGHLVAFVLHGLHGNALCIVVLELQIV